MEVIRGRVPVHRVSSLQAELGCEFVHTTHLQGTKVNSNTWLRPELASHGPLVLLPRVGAPASHKIVLTETAPLVLSDCVYGLRTGNLHGARQLQDILVRNSRDLAALYSGSCALYLTVERLLDWLRLHDFCARRVRANEAFTCGCSDEVDSTESQSAS